MTHFIKKNMAADMAMAPRNRGYTLLFAVLITSIVLSVSISILSVSRKEFLLSSSARESAYAFYAADGGIECADYNDLVLNTFGTTTGTISVNCGGVTQTISGGNLTHEVVGATTTDKFSFSIPVLSTSPQTTGCANIVVQKVYTAGPPLRLVTTLTSTGYNIGYQSVSPPTCNTSNAKRVERQLKLTH